MIRCFGQFQVKMPPVRCHLPTVRQFEGWFVKLSGLTVISRVSSVKLTPPFVVLEAPFVDLMPSFVILTRPSVNSLPPFVTSNVSVRRNDDAVREIAFAARRFDPSVREIFRAARESLRRIRAFEQRRRRDIFVEPNPNQIKVLANGRPLQTATSGAAFIYRSSRRESAHFNQSELTFAAANHFNFLFDLKTYPQNQKSVRVAVIHLNLFL
jgi:hypothetical protein